MSGPVKHRERLDAQILSYTGRETRPGSATHLLDRAWTISFLTKPPSVPETQSDLVPLVQGHRL